MIIDYWRRLPTVPGSDRFGVCCLDEVLERSGYSVRGIANHILDLADGLNFGVTNMALNKLIYFVYEAFFLQQKKLLTNARIEAWEHGPVFREVYQDFKKYADKPIKDRARFYSVDSGELEISSANLTVEDSKFLTEVIVPLLPLSASKLREISHAKDGPWWTVWWYDGYANPGMEITPETILAASRHGGDI